MNYVNTFIQVAADSKAKDGSAPKSRGEAKTIAELEYELISARPYEHTQEDVQFHVHVERTGVRKVAPKPNEAELREAFFSKPMACMRTSALAKTYGWGLHFNKKGRVALVPVGTPEYEALLNDQTIAHTRAMSTKRVK
jgi:Family of unknown function (DUF6157)